MLKKILYAITIINIVFQIIYTTIGNITTTDLGMWIYIFYIFRAEYMIVSGVVAFLVLCVTLVIIMKSIKNIYFFDVIILLLNVEYLIFYRFFMSIQ